MVRQPATQAKNYAYDSASDSGYKASGYASDSEYKTSNAPDSPAEPSGILTDRPSVSSPYEIQHPPQALLEHISFAQQSSATLPTQLNPDAE